MSSISVRPAPPIARKAQRRKTWLLVGAAVVVAVLAVAGTIFALTRDDAAGTYSLFADADTSGARQRTEGRPMEVGLRFRADRAGQVSAVKFLKAPGDPSPHTATVWSADGKQVASSALGKDDEGESGWQTAEFDAPVDLAPGEYVVSYHTSSYMASDRYFSTDGGAAADPVGNGPLTVDSKGVNGVYGYGNEPTFPTRSDRATNFWVDLVFATSETSAAPTSAPATPSVGPGLAVPEPVPGTASWADYYRQWSNGPNPTGDPRYFPIGVWMQDPTREAVPGRYNGHTFQEIGITTDVGIWDDDGSYDLRRQGLIGTDWRAFVHPGRLTDVLADTAHAKNFTGYLLADEPDMLKMEGDVLHPDRQPSAINALADRVRKQDPSRPTYVNFSKWMVSYKGDAGYQEVEYGTFEADMRAYCKAADLVSADLYGYTDPWEGVEQRGAWAYGRIIDNLRKYCGPEKPVWGFVETAQPFYPDQLNGAPAITADQMEAAIWSMLVHGANGWVYFSHDFGYGTGEDSLLRKPEIKARAAAINKKVKELAPVLNAFTTDEVTVAPGTVPVSVMHKNYAGKHYLFAQTDGTPELPQSGPTKATFTVPGSATMAKVLYENRTVPIVNGQIVDDFKPYQVHIYEF